MSPLLDNALAAITDRINLSTGLVHPNDKAAAKELFVRLRAAGEPLPPNEIAAWAEMHGWKGRDARALGLLASHVPTREETKVVGTEWWREEILAILAEEVKT